MNEFNALNEDIVKGKEMDDATILRFNELAQLYAQKQVEGFQCTEEEQKEIIENEQNKSDGDHYKEEIESAQDYMLQRAETSQIPLEYLWACARDDP